MEEHIIQVLTVALSEKYRCPVILLMDEVSGHMREKIELPDNYDEIPQAERKRPTCAPEDYRRQHMRQAVLFYQIILLYSRLIF